MVNLADISFQLVDELQNVLLQDFTFLVNGSRVYRDEYENYSLPRPSAVLVVQVYYLGSLVFQDNLNQSANITIENVYKLNVSNC